MTIFELAIARKYAQLKATPAEQLTKEDYRLIGILETWMARMKRREEMRESLKKGASA